MIRILGQIASDEDAQALREKGNNVVSPSDVRAALNGENADDITVEISSPGGNVVAGSEIYSMLRASGKNIIVNVTGIAASAASVIATAGNKVLMSPTAQIMIHNARLADGTQTDDTRVVSESLANAYALKSNLSREQINYLMENETYITAGQAVKYGLADGLMFNADNPKIVAELKTEDNEMDPEKNNNSQGTDTKGSEDNAKLLQDILAELKAIHEDMPAKKEGDGKPADPKKADEPVAISDETINAIAEAVANSFV